MTARAFYYKQTGAIRVTVRPLYLGDQSAPQRRHFVFAYFVRIENVGTERTQLLSRYWFIHDSTGADNEVRGPGVVGEQPMLEPGDVHEYQSFCVLKSPSGYMEGHYTFANGDGDTFDAAVPRFELEAPSSAADHAD